MRRFLLAAGLTLVACKPSTDPDKGRYSCTTDADCGTGLVCKAQFSGGGRCFKPSECSEPELCNGVDDTCDGRVDETFPTEGATCDTTKLGVCAKGKRACVLGAETCAQTVMASTERCNTLDDDCDGTVDDGFDLTSDDSNCGVCGVTCATGTSCLSSFCHEVGCLDGLDNDSNGRTDCDDASCFIQECNTATPPAWRCGVVSLLPDGGQPLDAGITDPDGGIHGCFAPELDCANGYDDDGDGLADCQDTDCDAQLCFSGTMCSNHLCPGPG